MRFTIPLLVVLLAPSTATAQSASLRDQVVTAGISEELVIADYPALPLHELTSAAGTVVHVTIRRSHAFLSSDGASMLTDYKAVVMDVVKSPSTARLNVGDEITIRRTGGVMNIEGRTVYSNEAGFPQFAAPAEYVLFLRTQPGQPFELVTGPYSAFRVQNDAIVFGDQNPPAASIPVPLFVREVKAK
jgi:hypothetical protein